MRHREDRRGFMGLLGSGGIAAALLSANRGVTASEPGGNGAQDGEMEFVGKGQDRGLFKAIENAFTDAVGKAKRELNSDLVTWSPVEMACSSGGVTGMHAVTVKIRAKSKS